jgi:hypothetical protein
MGMMAQARNTAHFGDKDKDREHREYYLSLHSFLTFLICYNKHIFIA